jgi:outer membrane murein-binding lipoprotein Lpp
MRRQIFTVALLALSLASASNLPAQDNRNGNTKQPTIEDRIDQLEQNEQNLKSQVDQLRNDVAYLQDRMKRVEEGKQLPQTPLPAAHSGKSGRSTNSAESQTPDSGSQQSYDVFYQGLQSGGHWFNDPTYGEVWPPDVARQMATGDPTVMDTGLIPTKAGPGFRMKISAGQPITTGLGHGAVTQVGFGFPGADGLRLGSPGEKVAIMWVGPRYLRRWQMTRKHGWEAGSITTMTSVP